MRKHGLRSISPFHIWVSTTVISRRYTYRAAVEGAHDAIITVTDDGRIVEANPAAGALFGVDHTDRPGRLLTDWFVEPDTSSSLWAAGDPSERAPVTAIDAAGAERVIAYTATSDIVDGHHLFVGRDVTERVAREAELTRKIQAVDAAPIGIILTDPTAPDTDRIRKRDLLCAHRLHGRRGDRPQLPVSARCVSPLC